MLFLNISMQAPGEALVPWWQHPEVKMKAGLDPRTQVRTPCGDPWLLGFRTAAVERNVGLCYTLTLPFTQLPRTVPCLQTALLNTPYCMLWTHQRARMSGTHNSAHAHSES